MYGSARKTCAEARTLTAMEEASVALQGSVSAAASVNLYRRPTGTLMEACEQACAPVLKKQGIKDVVADSSSMTSSGLNPALPAAAVLAPEEDSENE